MVCHLRQGDDPKFDFASLKLRYVMGLCCLPFIGWVCVFFLHSLSLYKYIYIYIYMTPLLISLINHRNPGSTFWGVFLRCPLFWGWSLFKINQSVLPFGCDVNKKKCHNIRFRFGWTLHQNCHFINLKNCQFIRMVYWNCHFIRRGIIYIYIYI